MNTEQTKSLGQIAFEAFDSAQDLGDHEHWYQQPTSVQGWWETSASAVRDAVKPEEKPLPQPETEEEKSRREFEKWWVKEFTDWTGIQSASWFAERAWQAAKKSTP